MSLEHRHRPISINFSKEWATKSVEQQQTSKNIFLNFSIDFEHFSHLIRNQHIMLWHREDAATLLTMSQPYTINKRLSLLKLKVVMTPYGILGM
jgi:replication initiation and membrane attachment protein DnaB